MNQPEKIIEDILPFDKTKAKKPPIERRIKDWYINKFKNKQKFLINMELSNGNHRSFLVVPNGGVFRYSGKTYVIDQKMKYWNIDSGINSLDYHEELSMPIKRVIPVESLKKVTSVTEYKDIRMALNPQNLKNFMSSAVTEKVLRGSVDDAIRRIFVIAVIICLITAAHLILYMQKSGMFDSIT